MELYVLTCLMERNNMLVGDNRTRCPFVHL